jgi:ribosome production factor 2
MDQKVVDKAEAALQKVTAKTARGKRVLQSRLPQITEDVKSACFIRGTTTSPAVNSVLTDLYLLKKPEAVFCQRRNKVHPFDGSAAEGLLEFLMQKNDTAMAVCATHSKKRPHNITIVRTFDGRILDMAELGVRKYEAIEGSAKSGSLVGSKPCFVVVGEQFEMDDRFKRVKSLLVDLYRGRVVETVDLIGLETCIVLTATGSDQVSLRVYRVSLKSSGTSTPSVHLSKLGPFIDFAIGRTRDPSPELWAASLRCPKEIVGGKKVKNVSRSKLGHKFGRVHVGKQEIETIQTRKTKALRPSKGKKEEKGKKPVVVANSKKQ